MIPIYPRFTRRTAAVGLAVTLAACGGGAEAPTSNGVFLDAAVEGLEYVAGTSAKAATTANGGFTCKQGETVTFSVGGITLGSAACAASLTPLNLAGTNNVKDNAVVNRLIALQSLDDDADPANGIRIASAVRTALAGRTLDFTQASTAFNAALTATLAALPAAYQARPVDDDRRTVARDHFEDTLAVDLGAPVNEAFSQTNGPGTVAVTVTRYNMRAATSFYIPYEGSNAATRADFANGFLPAYGSGLAFKGRLADGTLEFYAITDRGPNGDGPNIANTLVGSTATGTTASKLFPAPSFAPAYGVIALGKDGAVLKSSTPIRFSATQKATGLSLAPGKVGSSGEATLTDDMKYEPAKANYSDFGLDTESIVVDTARNALWVSDEYGPFIVKIDPSTGTVLKKYQPGPGAADLPAILAKRRANRGMEGLTLDVASGKLHGFLQSPIDDGSVSGRNVRDFAQFARWIEFDPTTETSKLFAYPIDGALYDRSRTGNAKLGDLASIGNGKFIVIEQGLGTNGKVFNWLMLVEVPANATNIAAIGSELEKNSMSATFASPTAYSAVVTLRKTLLLDLNKVGWLAEKAEGLAMVDDTTLALTNDNDFGMKTIVTGAAGASIAGADITSCTVSATQTLTGCPAGTVSARIGKAGDIDRAQRVWLLKFGKKLTDYAVPTTP